MQDLNDDELGTLLHQWRAPGAPSALEDRLVAAAGFSRRQRWLQWLVTGTIRAGAGRHRSGDRSAMAGFSVRASGTKL